MKKNAIGRGITILESNTEPISLTRPIFFFHIHKANAGIVFYVKTTDPSFLLFIQRTEKQNMRWRRDCLRCFTFKVHKNKDYKLSMYFVCRFSKLKNHELKSFTKYEQYMSRAKHEPRDLVRYDQFSDLFCCKFHNLFSWLDNNIAGKPSKV